MNPNAAFLSHIQRSNETVSQWPSWKTEMWTQPINTASPNLDIVRTAKPITAETPSPVPKKIDFGSECKAVKGC